MNIAIVDDNREDRDTLCSMLEQYCAARNIALELNCFSSGHALLDKFVPGHYQCVFLDIYLDDMDGMETAREIYQIDPQCRLIFATISTSHAVSSYEVRAAWYLTKPFSSKRLADAMDAACANLVHNSRMLTVHVNGTPLNIRYGNIFFMDCINRQTRLYLEERILQVDESVTELIGRLSTDERFLLCNRSTLVNMDKIELVEEHDFRLKNGLYVPLRQRGRASLKKAFLSWSLRDLRERN